MRLHALDGLEMPSILDAYAANGAIWDEINRSHPCHVTRIEKNARSKGIYLKGDNVRWMASIDLNRYDVIDLDAYGSPINTLDEVFRQGYTGTVVVTWIASISGTTRRLYQAIGISREILEATPTIVRSLTRDCIYTYLFQKGIKRLNIINNIVQNDMFQKFYFSFKMPNL